MGYKTHPVFEKPSDENATIWRYMSFSRFVWLMDRSQLYFRVLNQLEDVHEATLPWAYLSNCRSTSRTCIENHVGLCLSLIKENDS